jgi:choline dehydrogenase-like flavoprotein
MATKYDIAIIGTGAGGGTLAYSLAPTGKKILILERGGFLPREVENWSPGAVFNQARYKTHEPWYDRQGEEFHPGTHYYVGGNTKVYGAVLFRLRKEDFGEIRHYGGLSPAWPIKYEDMAPWYTKAEHLYSVHGQRGIDPTDPPGDPYAHPAVSHEPRIQEIVDDITRKTGLHPFPLPLGVRLDEQRPELSECVRCGTCDGFPCLVNAKSDAHTTCVMPALKHDNVTLVTNAKVTRLVTDAGGRTVTGIEAEVNGKKETFQAGIVVSSCGAINSAALLLRSASDKHRNGLANSSGQLGRNYMCHLNSAILSVSNKPNPTKFQKTFGINDFYFKGPHGDYPLGHIQTLGKATKEMLEGDAPFLTPGLALDYMATHSIDWWITSEDLPDPENRVTLTRSGDVCLNYTPNNEEGHNRLLGKLKDIVHEIGADFHFFPSVGYLSKRIPLAGVAHQVGTTRFGSDPKTSVLDVNCKAHDVDNLYVVDGGFFCSSSAVNPALTIMANALRVGEHLASRMK